MKKMLCCLLLLSSFLLLLLPTSPSYASTAHRQPHSSPTATSGQSTDSSTPSLTVTAGPDSSVTPTTTQDSTETPMPSSTPVSSVSPPLIPTTTYPQMYIAPGNGSKAYYVSPSGSDSNDGSQAQPFATIQKAADVATPGTIVHVLPGAYLKAVTVKNSGTANARISFVSDVKWAAQIHTTNSDDPWMTRADYIDIIGFDISSDGARDGIVNMGSYTRTIANRIHNVPGKCDDIGGSGVTDGNYQAHDNDIIGNVVYNIGSTYPKLCQYVHAIYHSNARGHIYNNIAYDNAGNGINLWHAATGTVIANNLTFGNEAHGISLGTNVDNTNGQKGDNFIVTNNISINNARLGIRERIGVGSHNQYVNNIVYGNGTAPFGDESYNWPPSSGSKVINTISNHVLFMHATTDGNADYHLQVGSIAIDAGTTIGAPSIDIDGNARPQGKGIDIGPFEYLQAPQVTPTPADTPVPDTPTPTDTPVTPIDTPVPDTPTPTDTPVPDNSTDSPVL